MGGPRKVVTPPVEAEVRRLVTRFAIERVAAGWSVWDLSQETGVHRSNINRFEAGATVPTLTTLVGLAHVMGLRVDVVPAHLQPLLALEEPEVRALLAAAYEGWRHVPAGTQTEQATVSALRKLGRMPGGVQSGGDEVDGD